MTNWTYAPRYHSGARPFGTFAAKRFRTFNTWISNSDLGRDVAMVTTWPLNGNKIVNVTGGHGLSWNYSRTQAMTVMGYPGAGPWRARAVRASPATPRPFGLRWICGRPALT